MFDRALRDFWIGIERVRIVTKAADLDTLVRSEAMDFVNAVVREGIDIDMCHAGELSFGFPNRPTHQLDALKILFGRKS